MKVDWTYLSSKRGLVTNLKTIIPIDIIHSEALFMK